MNIIAVVQKDIMTVVLIKFFYICSATNPINFTTSDMRAKLVIHQCIDEIGFSSSNELDQSTILHSFKNALYFGMHFGPPC